MSELRHLYGEILEHPWLKFSPSMDTARSKSVYKGLSSFGPYDQHVFPNKKVNLGIIFPEIRSNHVDNFISAFEDGVDRFVGGFPHWFKVQIERFHRIPIKGATDDYARSIEDVTKGNYDLIFVVMEAKADQLYSECKTKLSANGFPCQIVLAENLVPNDRLQWVVMNIALASYAKLGGTPWVIDADDDEPQIVVGVSRARPRSQSGFIVGFTTVFKHNGDFLFFGSKSPISKWEDYEENLKDIVVETIQNYAERERIPKTIVFHIHKRTGIKEVNAVNQAMDELGCDIDYALLHLNTDSTYRLFDTSHTSYIPPSGWKVTLGRRQALLLTDGRSPTGRVLMGTPRVLHITMDKSSTMSFDEFPKLVEQVYHLASVNWRGINARSISVTINYSSLIARMVANLKSVESWNNIVANGRLSDKAWFL